ncbi:MAG: CotH kinase family protein [Prolixibacteraceae bacterium]
MRRLFVGICVVFFSFLSIGELFAQELIFNEVMSSNQQYMLDSDNDTPDWFELYNAGTTPINLADYSVNDNLDPDLAWTFPSYSINPGAYILVFASGKDRKDFPLYWNTIITEGDTWKYIVPSSEPVPAWKNISFIDSGWEQGPSGFGYGDDDDQTVLNKANSVFIRKIFVVNKTSDVVEGLLHMDYDDAFVAYLNGTEIARANISSNGAPAYNAIADNSNHEARMYSGGLPDAFEIENIQSLIITGNNVLAIQVHNAGSNSSDLSAIPFLSLGFSVPVDGQLAPFVEVPQKKFHTDFNISADGESLYLFKKGIIADSVQLPALPTNISYGRNAQHENSWFYFSEPTPENNNSSKAYSFLAGEVTFSVPGGIYNSAFRLSLSSNNVNDKIYYTTDNTEPTVDDLLYSSPINISATTMFRAAVINPNGIPGFVSTQSYFFGIHHDLPVISLVTAPDNFFSYDSGIYVNGPPKPSSGENCDNGANYWQDWEVPVHISMIETDGNLAFEQNAGVKIFGGCSRNNAQKSLSLRFRKRYGKDGLNYKVFDDLDIDTFHSLNLRSSGNDWNGTMFRDGLQTHLFPESIDKTAFRPAVVYINGEYWGIHNIRERIDEDYIASHHQVDPNSINIMEFHVNWLVNLVEGDDQHLLDLLEYIDNNDLTLNQNYEYVSTQMDVENFALYQAANICIKNTDWPGNNVKYWQSTEADMKWRWITFDTDFGFTDINHNTLTFALADNVSGWPNPAQSTYLLRQLNKNQKFRNLFINAFADELNTLWDKDELYALIDQMKGDIASEIPNHFNRWGANPNSWSNNVNGFYSFAAQRPEVVRRFVENYYGLKGRYTLTLNVNDQDQGEIKLNTIQPNNYPWAGSYFNNVPVTLTALPKRGYRFVRWEGSLQSTQATLEVALVSSTQLKAIFEKEETLANVVLINEIFYNNLAGETPQDWIELYNTSNQSVDVSAWKVKDANDSHQFEISPETYIEANDYLVICRDKVMFSNFYSLNAKTLGNFDFGLSDTDDCVRLFDNKDYLIDSIAYSNSELDSTIAFSYQRFKKANLTEWYNVNGIGTPLAANSKTPSSNKIKHNFNVADVLVYPNPFSEQLSVVFLLPKSGTVNIRLLSQNGLELMHSSLFYKNEGQQLIELDNVAKLSPGVYIFVVQTEEYLTTRKVIKL